MEKLYSDIFEEIRLPIIIWKKKEKDFFCFLTNGKIESIEKNMEMKDYIFNNDSLKNIYKDIDTFANKQTKETEDSIITFNKMGDDFICEIRYPIYDPVNDDLQLIYFINQKMRTPLTNIIGMFPLLEEIDLSDSKRYKCLEIIKKSSYEMVTIINDLIDIVNLKRDNIVLDNEPINLNKFMIDVKNILKDILQNKKKIIINLDKHLPTIIIIDKLRLHQIVIGLIKNLLELFNGVDNFNISITLFDKNNLHDCPFEFIENERDDEFNVLFKIETENVNEDKKDMIDALLYDKQYNVNVCEPSKARHTSCVHDKQTKIIKSHKSYGFDIFISKKLCNLMKGNIWHKNGTIFFFNIICNGIKV